MSRANAGITCNVAAAIVGHSFDSERPAIAPAKPMLNCRHHQVPHVIAGDAARGGEEARGFPKTAVERERELHPLAIVTADLEAVGAPAPLRSSTARRKRARSTYRVNRS